MTFCVIPTKVQINWSKPNFYVSYVKGNKSISTKISQTFFLIQFYVPFDFFSSYEMGQSVGGRKRENPEKNHLAHPQAELGGLKPTLDTAVR